MFDNKFILSLLLFFDSGYVGKKSGPGSGINILDPQQCFKLFIYLSNPVPYFYNLAKVVNSTFYWRMQVLTLTCFFLPYYMLMAKQEIWSCHCELSVKFCYLHLHFFIFTLF
jgi:hypothetical protein